MKIDIFDVEEFIKLNHLQEITSTSAFQHGNIPHPKGLFSNEIFGVTTKSRKETYAYINLHGHFFHPHIYKVIRRMFRNIDKIVNGENYYSINKDGYLYLDPDNGNTGIEWLYENWEKIKWENKKSDSSVSMRDERVSLVTECKKNEIFMKYQIVIPVFYRDIKSGSTGIETDDLNNLYTNILRLSGLLENQSMFGFQFNSTNYNIQTTIVAIYDYFKNKIEKKGGLIRKYLMGKNTDYASRTVITGPSYHADSVDDLFVDFEHAILPISQVCDLAYPFVTQYIRDFFERELFDTKNNFSVYSIDEGKIVKSIELDNPESYYNDKFIKKMLDTYIRDPESRFNTIEVPYKGNKKYVLAFFGKRLDASNKSELASISNRPMTWTDLLYMACEKVTRDKHCLISRYPILDEYGISMFKIRIASTQKTIPMQVGDQIYRWYPDIDLKLPKDQIGNKFIDSVQFSNSFLKGLQGDYDGDQTTVKIVFTQEANEEIEHTMKSKAYFINASGKNIRGVGNEITQTMYVLTKDPLKTSRKITDEEKEYLLSLHKEDYTFSKLVELLGDTLDAEDDKPTKPEKSKFNPTDYLEITKKDFPNLDSDQPITTTVGRVIFNRIFIEGLNLDTLLPYNNKVLTDGVFGGFEGQITDALKDDKISVDTMIKYIDLRDWFGLQVHPLITSSFTLNTIILPEKTKALKKKLLKDNKEAIENNDVRAIENIEQQLIASVKDELQDDVGMDLYNSGARGSMGNNYKNMFLTRGSAKNLVTKKYEIIANSLIDGLEKKDIPMHSNMLVAGAYPKAVGTQVSGYMLKELVAAMQTEVISEDRESDCGSKMFIHKKITTKNLKDNMYRYIKGNDGKLVQLTKDNSNEYIDKVVEMRSPMYCIGVGKNKCLCSRCAGDFYYKLGKLDIGLSTGSLAGTLSNLNMKKFHDNVVKMHNININDILV